MNLLADFAGTSSAAVSGALAEGARTVDLLSRATTAQRATLAAAPAPALKVAPALAGSLLVTRADGSRALVTSGGASVPLALIVLGGLALLVVVGSR